MCELKVQKRNLAQYKSGRIQLSAPKWVLHIKMQLWQNNCFCSILLQINKRCQWLAQSRRRSMSKRSYWHVQHFLWQDAKTMQQKWMQLYCQLDTLQVDTEYNKCTVYILHHPNFPLWVKSPKEKFSTVKKRPHSIKCTKTTSTLRKATKMAWLRKVWRILLTN